MLPSPSMSFTDLIQKVHAWGEARQLYRFGDPRTQCLKTMAEVGELVEAVESSNLEDIQLEIGDVMITLINLAELCNVEIPIESIIELESSPPEIFTDHVTITIRGGQLCESILSCDINRIQLSIELMVRSLHLIATHIITSSLLESTGS